ncbi:MAG: hypothetical protein DMF94_15810 [Acidobacteria bacterium]|nr:MAG: hypothetical protein DMF94_15810 [Acidobacteriota bacterium]
MDTFTPTGFTDKCNHENTKNTKNGTKKTTFLFRAFVSSWSRRCSCRCVVADVFDPAAEPYPLDAHGLRRSSSECLPLHALATEILQARARSA